MLSCALFNAFERHFYTIYSLILCIHIIAHVGIKQGQLEPQS